MHPKQQLVQFFLSQEQVGKGHPISYGFRVLNDAEKKLLNNKKRIISNSICRATFLTLS